MSIRPFHHQRPLVAAALAFGAGIWAGVRFFYVPWLFGAGIILSLMMACLLHRIGRRWILGGMMSFLFLGMLLSGIASHPVLPPQGNYQVEGIVAEDVILREDGTAAGYLESVTVTADGASYTLPKVYWTYYYEEDQPFLPGDGEKVRFHASLYHPRGQTNPYGFDFRMFLLQKGAAAGVSGARDAEIIAVSSRGLSSLLYRIRGFLSAKVQDVFGEGSALPEALLLGNREHLPQDVQDSFSSAGVAHILAVSGLHVGLLAGALQMLLRKWLSPRGRLWVLSLFLLLYCALLNFSAPVVRASVLLVLAGMRRVARRSLDRLTTLSAAFLLILLFRPLDLFSASFQLSFGAVLGIAMLGPVLERPLSCLHFRFLREGAGITISAAAGSILPTIQIFHRFSLVGLVINPVVCWIFGLLLPAYALVLLIGCIYLPLGQGLAVPVNWAAGWISRAIQWVGNLPFASLDMPSLPWYVILALVFSIVLCTRYVVLPCKKRVILAVTALMVSIGTWQGTICRDVQYLQLEMGQADAALILDGRETILIDTGDYGGDVVSYLKATGRQADRVIITHLHTDHFLGMNELLEAEIKIGEVILPEAAFDQAVGWEAAAFRESLEKRNIPIRFWAAGDQMATGRVRIEATWPISGAVRTAQDANRYPLTLICDLDGVKLFSASDIAGEFEGYAARDADLLKVSHHGSKGSTGAEFLSLVSPSAAIITASPGSKSLPHHDTLSRLENAAVSVYNTGDWGAIHIRIRDGQAILTPYLSKGVEP